MAWQTTPSTPVSLDPYIEYLRDINALLQTSAQCVLEIINTDHPIPTTGFVAQWGQYTTGPHRNIQISDGTHYIVSTHYLELTKVRNISDDICLESATPISVGEYSYSPYKTSIPTYSNPRPSFHFKGRLQDTMPCRLWPHNFCQFWMESR